MKSISKNIIYEMSLEKHGIKMKLFYYIFLFLLVSCGHAKWNEQDWKKTTDLGQHPHREAMVEDLLQNHKLTGLHYNSLIQKLGPPDFLEPEDRSISYGLATNYGLDIDPTGLRSLQFHFDNDSIIVDFKIIES